MIPFGMPAWLVVVLLFVGGAYAGRFLNRCIERIPRKDAFWESLRGLGGVRFAGMPTAGRLPIIGWLFVYNDPRRREFLRSPREPAIELLNAFLFVLMYWCEVPFEASATLADSLLFARSGPLDMHSGVLAGGPSPIVLLHVRYLYHLILLEALIVASFIDIDLMIIPDGVTLPVMAVGLMGAFAFGNLHLVPVWFQSPSIMRQLDMLLPPALQGWTLAGGHVPGWCAEWPHLHGLAVSVAGLVVGGGVVWGVRVIGAWVLKREAMGFGDVILMGMVGIFLGWQPTIVAFFIAPVCALAVVIAGWLFWRHHEIPYGPYLSLGTIAVLFTWPTLWPIAERWFSFGPLLIVVAIVMAVMLAATLFFVQGVKRLMGIELYPEEILEEWTSADQLAHNVGENVDTYQGRWRINEWPGGLSARGQLHEQTWRHKNPGSGNQAWQRRNAGNGGRS